MSKTRRKTLKSNRKEQSRHRPRFGKKLLLVLAVLTVAVVGGIAMLKYARKRPPPPVPALEWQRYSPGNSTFSLLLPGEPQSESVELPEPLRAKVKQSNRFRLSVGSLQVSVWSTTFLNEVPADIQKAAEGAVLSLRASPGVTGYVGHTTELTRSARPGMRITGTYERYSEKMAIEAMLLGDGPKLWQVIITYPTSERDAYTASKRVLDSVRIGE